ALPISHSHPQQRPRPGPLDRCEGPPAAAVEETVVQPDPLRLCPGRRAGELRAEHPPLLRNPDLGNTTPGRNPADARWQVSRAGDSGAVAAGDLSLSARPEKLRKNRPTLLRQHPALDLHPVVQPGLFQYLAAADDGAGAGFTGAEDQAGDAAVDQQ